MASNLPSAERTPTPLRSALPLSAEPTPYPPQTSTPTLRKENNMNYTKSQEAHLLRRAEKYRTIDEIRKMNTKQGKFERSYLHYDWHDDFEESRCDSVSNDALPLVGRRDMSLKSPADIVQLAHDFDYFEDLLKRTNPKLHQVFQAVFYGDDWRDLGMSESSWFFLLEKLEAFLNLED